MAARRRIANSENGQGDLHGGRDYSCAYFGSIHTETCCSRRIAVAVLTRIFLRAASRFRTKMYFNSANKLIWMYNLILHIRLRLSFVWIVYPKILFGATKAFAANILCSGFLQGLSRIGILHARLVCPRIWFNG